MKTAKLDETRPKLIHFNMLRQGSKTFAVALISSFLEHYRACRRLGLPPGCAFAVTVIVIWRQREAS